MTDSDVQKITRSLKKIEDHLDRQDTRFDHCDTRFGLLDERLDGIDGRLENHVVGPGAKRTAATGGSVAAVVTTIVLAVFECLRRLHIGV
jgi:hypothetical protein